MKKIRRFMAVAIAMAMVMLMNINVLAQTVESDQKGPAKITITNASKGETYKVSKLFDATVSDTKGADQKNTSIAYTGDIPSSLESYFLKDSAGNVSLKAGADISDEAFQNALKSWASENVTKEAVSDGSTLEFTKLPYGYYVVTTTQGEGLITVDSTRPNAAVIDKNTTPPVDNLSKSADETDVYIGQTVTYTVSFATANYIKEEGKDPEQIVTYTITDTPATNSLTDITVTGIKVDDDGDTDTTADQTALNVQQFSDNKITINWTDNQGKAGTSLYKNGATLILTYTAKVAAAAAVDGKGNTNTVSISYKTDKGTEPEPDTYTETETIYTYAIAVKKVDQSGSPLADAVFQLPFYVQGTAAEDGAYVYAGTTAGDELVNELTTPANGLLIVKGLKTGTYSITETAAPRGYNKLTAPVSVKAVKTGETTTSTTTYLDADGNITDQRTEGGSVVEVSIQELAATPVVVVNKTGSVLPSTGGIGTTIFYMLGAVLVLGAGIVMVIRHRKAE